MMHGMLEILLDRIAECTGIPTRQFTVIKRPRLTHQSNRLYDIRAEDRHWIVKEYLKEEEWGDAPLREYSALMRLLPLDIAPQPMMLFPGPPPCVIYEFMAGEMWGQRKPSAGELAQLASAWLQINSLDTEGLWVSRGYTRPLIATAQSFKVIFEHYNQWAALHHPGGQSLASLCLAALAQRAAVISALDRDEVPICFCRSDPRFSNVIRRPDGRVGMVDWEDSGLRDPARDLADLLTHPEQEHLLEWDDWAAFLSVYAAERQRADPRLLDRMHAYLGLFPFFWLSNMMNTAMKHYGSARLNGWTVNGMEPNLRMRRYVARLLAWPGYNLKEKLTECTELTLI